MSFSRLSTSSSSITAKLGIHFEVYGIVQGVFFRKYTQSKARELGLIGWVKNTEKGTVLGQAEGDSAAIASMKNWLCNVGSPSSKIEKCDIKEYGELELSHLKDFVVVA